MATIHTLGPKTTDSYQAASHLQDEDPDYRDLTITLHPNFEAIYQHLADFAGDYFLVPTAYQSADGDSWTRNNYRYLDQLTIKKTFALATMPMLLTENTNLSNKKAVLHSATEELIQQFMSDSHQNLDLDFVPSKPLAQHAFEQGAYQYAIFSRQSFQPHDGLTIVREYHPEMVWCLYQIKS